MKTKEIRILKDLISVKESCEQGISGEWDCSTDEGKEGFEAMSINLDDAITILPELLQMVERLKSTLAGYLGESETAKMSDYHLITRAEELIKKITE